MNALMKVVFSSCSEERTLLKRDKMAASIDASRDVWKSEGTALGGISYEVTHQAHRIRAR